MRVTPPGRRSTIRTTPEGLEISIPAKRNIFAVVFLAFWLCGWAAGEFTVIGVLLMGKAGDGLLFLCAWLAMWTTGGTLALYSWLWMVFGREILLMRADALVVKWDIRGCGRTKEYDLEHTKHLRVASTFWNLFAWRGGMPGFFGNDGGLIAFDYGFQTIRVGAGIDEAEAREIIQELSAACYRRHHALALSETAP